MNNKINLIPTDTNSFQLKQDKFEKFENLAFTTFGLQETTITFDCDKNRCNKLVPNTPFAPVNKIHLISISLLFKNYRTVENG